MNSIQGHAGLFLSSITDPYYSSVVSLLHFNGANASTVIVDNISTNTWTSSGNCALSSGQAKFGSTSLINTTGAGTCKLTNITPVQISSGQDFTIEFFIYPISGSRMLDTYTGTTGNNIIFQITSGLLTFYDIGVTRSTGLSVPSNAWSFITLVRSSGTITPYVDGIAGTSWTYTGAYNFAQLTFLLDVYSSTAFNGYMDEYRQTNGIARYTSNFTPPSAPFPDS